MMLLVFSICYALNGYNAIYMSNIIWLDGVLILPLMADGISQIVKEGGCLKYYFSLVYALLTNFYIGYMLCFFSALYFAYCFFKYRIPEDNKFAGTGKLLGRYLFFSIMAVLTDAFMLLPMSYQLVKGKMSSGDNSGREIIYLLIEIALIVSILCLEALFVFIFTYLSKLQIDKNKSIAIMTVIEVLLALASWKTIQIIANKGYIDKRLFTWPLQMLIGAVDREELFPYELAHLYAGIIVFVILILYILDSRADSRAKLLDVLLFTTFILALTCYDVNLMLHGFAYPVGSPNRWTFIFNFFEISILLEYLVDNRTPIYRYSLSNVNKNTAFALFVILGIGIKCYLEYGMKYLHVNYTLISFACAAIYMFLLILFKKSFWYIIMPIVYVELCINISAVTQDYEFLAYSEYERFISVQNTINSLIEKNQIAEGKENETFRVESDFHENYYYISGYNSIYHYSSAQTSENKDFMSDLGYDSEISYIVPNNFNVDSEYVSFLSIKYLISSLALQNDDYKEIYHDEENDIFVYENLKYLPMAFFSPDFDDTDFKDIIPTKKELSTFLNQKIDRNIVLKGAPLSSYICDIDVMNEESDLFFSIPYDKGWKVKIDGKEAELIKSFKHYMKLENVTEGKHKIELYYVPPYLIGGIIVSMLSVIVIIFQTIAVKKEKAV